jgi:hypothetical protein
MKQTDHNYGRSGQLVLTDSIRRWLVWNKYPRSNDYQGLGDWEETKDKLPNVLANWLKSAETKYKFGIWMNRNVTQKRTI